MADNPAAFPYAGEYGHPASCSGMSLRDYFAGQVAPSIMDAMLGAGFDAVPLGLTVPQAVARKSYQLADALLAERAMLEKA